MLTQFAVNKMGAIINIQASIQFSFRYSHDDQLDQIIQLNVEAQTTN